MPDPSSLDSILDEKSPAAPASDQAPTPTPDSSAPADAAPAPQQSKRKEHLAKEYTAQGRDPVTGQFVSKEAAPAVVEAPKSEAVPAVVTPAVVAPPAAPPAAQLPLTERERAFLRAAEEERHKRQELERTAAAPKEEPKTFWDDPDAAFKRHSDEMHAVAQKTRLSTAETIARSKYPDFDEKIESFREMVTANPGIAPEWLKAADPAEYAYRAGKGRLELQQAGSIDALKAQIEKETRLKLDAEYKAKAEQEARIKAAIPGSLSDVQSVGVNRPAWGGPTPLDDILK